MSPEELARLRLIENDVRDTVTGRVSVFFVAEMPPRLQAEIRWGQFGWGFRVAQNGHSLMMPLYPPKYFQSPEAALHALKQYLNST